MHLLLAVVLLAAASATGAPYQPILYPAPDLTITGIAGDSRGFLWLATGKGLVRFDGVHFHPIPGGPVAAPRYVGVTRDDAVWVAGEGGVARYDGGWRLILNAPVASFAVNPEHVVVRAKDGKTREIGLNAGVHDVPLPPDTTGISVDEFSRIWQPCGAEEACAYTIEGKLDQKLPMRGGYRYVTIDRHGRLWGASDEKAERMEPPLELLRRPVKDLWRPYPLVQGVNNQLWFLGEPVTGVDPVFALQRSLADQQFPATAAYENRHRLHVAYRGLGLVRWADRQGFDRWFTEEFGKHAVSQVVRLGERVLAATHGGIYEFEDSQWHRLSDEVRNYAALFAEPDGTLLAAARPVGLLRLSGDGRLLKKIEHGLESDDWFRKILRDPSGQVWVGGKAGLLRLTGDRLEVEELPGKPRVHIVPDMDLDAEGRLWVAYQEGLAYRDAGGAWHQIPTTRPVTALRSFAFGGTRNGDDVWIAYRDPGRFSRLQRKGVKWDVTDFTPANGYGPADTDYVRRDSRGWIWRGTPRGVYICDGVHTAPADWLHYNRRSGLVGDDSEVYGFFEDRDNSVWISGADGVTRMLLDEGTFLAPGGSSGPVLTRVESGGVENLAPGRDLGTVAGTVLLEFGFDRASPIREFPFRYRLDGEREWHASNGVVEFRGLWPGSHRVEVMLTGIPNGGKELALQVNFRVSGVLWVVLGIVALALAAFGLWLRFSEGGEQLRYRVRKYLFLRRRRTGGEETAASDYSGQLLADRYRMVRPVSSGGFSTVYEAVDTRENGQRLAVKVIRPQERDGAWTRGQFGVEIASLQSIRHPGIVPLLDWWLSAAGEPCIAMPFLDGPTLRSAMERAAFSARRTARILRQLGAALGESHRRGIVHRDLKPENILLTRCGEEGEQAVIVDFGSASFRGPEKGTEVTRMLSGSIQYMAPERLSGRYAPASDIYSLAIIALEMRSGKRLDGMKFHSTDPEFQGELAELCSSVKAAAQLALALNPNPKLRPSDAKHWAEELARLIE